jgi:hypothetical protein
MLEFIPHDLMTAKLQAEELNILFCPAEELGMKYIQQLVEKSRQPHILKFEGPEDIGTPEAPDRLRT